MKALVAATALAVLASCSGQQNSAANVTSAIDRLGTNPHVRVIREQGKDAALAAGVSAAIAGQTGINVFHIGVWAHAGVVTLRGNVPTREIARTAVATARGVSGVRRVISHLTIQK